MASNALYPNLHAELKENHGVDFKFEKTGLKFVMYDDDDVTYAHIIADAVPHLHDQMRWLDADELRAEEPNISSEAIGALEFLCDHQVNPFLLTSSYTEAARQNGVTLFQNTNALGVQRSGSRVIGVLTQEHGLLGCGVLINAAGAWASAVSEWATGFRVPVRPVKGQIVLSEKLPKMLRGCVSTSDCYIAQKDNGEVLIGSTTEENGFDVTTTMSEIKVLVQGAVRCVPNLQHTYVKRCWAGLRPGTPDELPILGAMPGVDGYLNACGHFRTGILTSAITGTMIDHLVHQEPSPQDLAPFSVNRFLS
jgi:hydrogen cyanide synthase HcnC